MSQSFLSLKAFCKKNKVKLPKEPYMFKSYALQDMRLEIINYLRKKIDAGRGDITVKIYMDDSVGRLFSENDCYFFSSDKLGKHAIDDLSIGFLGEQLYYSLEKEKGWYPEKYERKFDDIEGLEEEWMHCIISNKEKRIVLTTGVPLQFSGYGYAPGQMVPGTITAVYEKEGEHYVCVEGQDDIYWFDLNIETKVALGEELYNEFIPQVTPQTIEEALTLIALEGKSKFDRSALASEAKTPASILAFLCEDKNEDVRTHLARNRSATPEILSKLANDTDTNVRQAVAENLNTPADCLAKLAEAKKIVIDFGRERDLCAYVRWAVAKNPNTPAEILVKLTEDPIPNVRDAASTTLKHPSWRLEEKEAPRASSQDKQAADSIPDIPADKLAQMAYDSDYHVRATAAENPNTPADCLIKLSKDIMWDVVKKVAENPGFPLEVLMAYANKEEKMIRLAVQNPSFPLPKLLELAQAACYYPKFYPTDAIIRALLNRMDSK